MDYTKNYHLPQWVMSDRILMEDFNNAMGCVESGMSGNAKAAADAKTAAGNAHAAADDAMNAANQAQDSADNAMDAAKKAQSTANTARKEAAVLPYVTGSYVGGDADKTITLGFRPSFVIISGVVAANVQSGEAAGYSCATGGHVATEKCRFNSDGFTVLWVDERGLRFPNLVNANRVYDYIAFR